MTARSYFPASMSMAFVALALVGGACGDDETQGTDKDTSASPDTTAVTDTSPTAATDSAAPTDTTPEPEVVTCALGTECDDGDPCTIDDVCDAAGACAGKAKCDDGLACTTDSCAAGTCTNTLLAAFCLGGTAEDVCVATGGKDPANTCQQCALGESGTGWITLGDNAACNDGDLCTTADKCQAGACVGGPALACPSDTPCIARACDPALGCVDTETTATCDDGDPCTVGDACLDGTCRAGTGALACDDDDPCTLDSCTAGVGCFFDAEAKCDDDQPCTADSCNATTGACTNAPIEAGGGCDDGNPCTTGETCNAQSACQGGAATVCDDLNECTIDSCSPAIGCVNRFRDEDCVDATCGPALCSDGIDCTRDDQCVSGACIGAKTSACVACPYPGTASANKIVSLELMSDGQAGSGLDIDQDPATCAPAGECGAGVDNALGPLAAIFNLGISDTVAQGVVKWVVDLKDATLLGAPFDFSIYDSGLSFESEIAGCDYQVEECSYEIAPLSFDPTCTPYFRFQGVTINGTDLVGDGAGQRITMVLPLASGALLTLTIAEAQVRATIKMDSEGRIVEMIGVFGGAVPKSQLIAAIRGLDPDDFSPAAQDLVIQLIEDQVAADIDLDGDLIDESASLAMRFRTIPAVIMPIE